MLNARLEYERFGDCTAEAQRTPSRILIKIHSELCDLRVSAVKSLFRFGCGFAALGTPCLRGEYFFTGKPEEPTKKKEGTIMNNKILVPLKRHDRLEEIVPYIEEVAQPGASVVFLVRHPVKGLKWLQAYCAIAQCGLEKNLAVRRMVESYSLKMRRHLFERRVFQTCAALHDMALNIAVDAYTESLRKTLRSYANRGATPLVIMKPGIGQRIVSFLQGAVSMRRMVGKPVSPPVMLFHAGR